MKKLASLVLAIAIVLSPTNQVFAKEIDSSDYIVNSYAYDYKTNYSSDEGPLVDVEDLDNIPAVCQFEDEICNHENSLGIKWYKKGCVVTSVSIMILRKACLEGYEYDGDPFSEEAVIDVLKEISNEKTLFRQSDRNLYWQGNCEVDLFSKDGESFFAQIETHPASEDNLITLLLEHPEGILVYGRHNEHYHGVLVTKYFGDGTYEVYDSATGTIETREYNYLNGYKNSHYKFASLAENEEE